MSDALRGTSWLLTGPFGIPEGVEATAEFADGTVSGRAGCNRYHGPYRADGVDFRIIGPLATTMMLCPPPAMEVEQAMLAGFAAATGMRLGGGRLELLAGDDGVVLSFVAQGPEGLAGEWQVASIHWPERQAIISVDAPAERPLTVVFDEGAVGGHSGCNSFHGSCTVAGTVLAIGPLTSTRTMCLDSAVMAQERALLAALGNTTGYRLEGSQLTLLRADGGISVGLERG